MFEIRQQQSGLPAKQKFNTHKKHLYFLAWGSALIQMIVFLLPHYGVKAVWGSFALSAAAGKTAVPYLTNSKNFNMNTTFKPDGNAWPNRGQPHYQRWLHNDMQNMAFFYTHKLFAKLVTEGGLE